MTYSQQLIFYSAFIVDLSQQEMHYVQKAQEVLFIDMRGGRLLFIFGAGQTSHEPLGDPLAISLVFYREGACSMQDARGFSTRC